STAGASSSRPGHTKAGQDMCALLTDEQLSTYMREGILDPERSNERDRPTCTWDGTATNKVELALWIPPIRTIITDDAERTIDVGDLNGYVQFESDNSCKVDIEGPERFLDIQIDWSDTADEDGKLCDSVADMAEGVVADLG